MRTNNCQFYRKKNGKIIEFCARVKSVDYSHGLIYAYRRDNLKPIEASWEGCKDIEEGRLYWFKPAGKNRGGNIDAKYLLVRPRRRVKFFGTSDGVSEQEQSEAKVISDALTKNYDLNKILKHLLNAAKIGPKDNQRSQAELKIGLWTEHNGHHEFYHVDMKTDASFSWLDITAKRRGKKYHGAFFRGDETPTWRYVY